LRHDRRCAICGEELWANGPIGYVHANGSMYGEDGHAVIPVSLVAYLLSREVSPPR